MRFAVPLLRGRLIKRYKRFLSDIELDSGAVVTAHCPNPGSMLGLDRPGSQVWIAPARGAARKLAYTWELVRVDGSLVGINAARANALAAEALAHGHIRELAGYATVRREVRYGTNSRIDLLLEEPGRARCYVEVKNVHLKRHRDAEFPDSVTVRGAKHLAEMAATVAAGARAVMLYVVQRDDGAGLAIAEDIDPAYAAALARARAQGVEVLCYSCKLSTEGITVDRALALHLERQAVP